MADSEDGSTDTMRERIGSMSESLNYLKSRMAEIESRMRQIENKEIGSLKERVHSIDTRVAAFDSASDDSKQKWSMALNFIVQLMWVVTASFVLAKLGLQMESP